MNCTTSIFGDMPSVDLRSETRLISAKPAQQLLGAQKAQAFLQNGVVGVLPQRVQASSAVQPEGGGEIPFFSKILLNISVAPNWKLTFTSY